MEHANESDIDLFEAFLTATDPAAQKLLAAMLGLDDAIVEQRVERRVRQTDHLPHGERRQAA